MSQDCLRQLRQHVSGASRSIQSTLRYAEVLIASHLNAFTRTPFFAHSTAKLDAICLTATDPNIILALFSHDHTTYPLWMHYRAFVAAFVSKLSLFNTNQLPTWGMLTIWRHNAQVSSCTSHHFRTAPKHSCLPPTQSTPLLGVSCSEQPHVP